MSATTTEELVTTALQRALLAQVPTPDLVVYSDRGGQYCGNYYIHKRLHSNIDYHTPYHTHQQLFQTTTLNCLV